MTGIIKCDVNRFGRGLLRFPSAAHLQVILRCFCEVRPTWQRRGLRPGDMGLSARDALNAVPRLCYRRYGRCAADPRWAGNLPAVHRRCLRSSGERARDLLLSMGAEHREF